MSIRFHPITGYLECCLGRVQRPLQREWQYPFQDIAIELGIDPTFIEKDWYAIQVSRPLPALIRHLHDLGALHWIILAEPKQFVETAQAAFAIDIQSGSRSMEYDLPAAGFFSV